MKHIRFVLLIVLLVAAAVAGDAQAALSLPLSTAEPKVDGVVSAKEYSLSTDASGMQVSLSRTAEVLYVAVAGPTTGWVAAGLGSAAMDKAMIYIGYVDGDTVQLKVQRGAGHSHSDTEGNAPVKFAMKEADGQTVLELALKASEFIAKGQGELELIAAMGGSDSFLAIHRARARLTVAIAD